MLARRAMMISALTACSAFGAAHAETSLETAPVDYSLYREGEVHRVEKHFGRWLLTCDVIPRLGSKFCSMRSVATSSDGTTVAAVTVSTDDRGQPAAILTLPYGTSIRRGLALTFARPSRARPSTYAVTLRPSQCGGLGCQVVWPIVGRDIADLRAAGDLRLTFQMTAGEPAFASLPTALPMTVVDGRLDMSGFSDALEASMH